MTTSSIVISVPSIVDEIVSVATSGRSCARIPLDLGALRRVEVGAAVGQVPLEGVERAGVVVHRPVNLADVVEDLVRGGEAVGAFELDERALVLAGVEELNAALEVAAGFVDVGFGGGAAAGGGSDVRAGG